MKIDDIDGAKASRQPLRNSAFPYLGIAEKLLIEPRPANDAARPAKYLVDLPH